MLRITPLLTTILLTLALACPAVADDAPQPLAAMSMPETLSDMSVQGAPDTGDEPAGAGISADYYTQKMSTVEGVITAIDLDNSTITIKDSDAERTYYFDELTRFQVRLKPVEPSYLKTGSKVAGLYRESEDALYISRVVVIVGKSGKSRRRRRR